MFQNIMNYLRKAKQQYEKVLKLKIKTTNCSKKIIIMKILIIYSKLIQKQSDNDEDVENNCLNYTNKF